MWRKRNPLALLVGMQTDAVTVENSMKAPQKFKIELPYDPIIALLDIYPPTYKNTDSKEYMHAYLCSSVIYNTQDMEAVQVSID